jgi:L-phenylalanine/L-methionine N-acetyltransferase
VPNAPPRTTSIAPALDAASSGIAGLEIRSHEPRDWQEIAALMDLPNVRRGTLGLPFTSKEQWRKPIETPPDGLTGIVAELDGRIVGHASLTQHKGRRSHVGYIVMSVHDDFGRRGIGSALMTALVHLSDNWLNLKRLELTVYVDNEAAIRLYGKFGFEVEGKYRADTFRDGQYVDSFVMARLKPGWSDADAERHGADLPGQH